VLLDLHFYFLDLTDHPCAAAFGGALDATSAAVASTFQNDYLGQLRLVLARAGLGIGTITFEDLDNHPESDALDASATAALFALGAHSGGVNVFFVREISPAGLQALGPSPGPAGLAGSRESGIAIGIDTLCYRTWDQLARLTAHELARYMGLYDNVEPDAMMFPTHVDPIADSDTSAANLMFFSELGGEDLSVGQRDVLTRSPVLR